MATPSIESQLPKTGDQVYGHNRLRRYTVLRELGKGGFGAVFEVVQDRNKETPSVARTPGGTASGRDARPAPLKFAMKCEVLDGKARILKMDLAILKALKQHGGRHFCNIIDRAKADTYNFIVMTLVGHSLFELKRACPEHHFSVGTALRVGIQTLESIEDFHEVAYLHRDIKPGNFAVGCATSKEECRKVYILDFGLARKFKQDNGEIRRPRTKAGFRGTVRYASLSSHNMDDLGRKDDLESWLYMLIELTNGILPWSHYSGKEKAEVHDLKNYARERRGCKEMLQGCPRNFQRILVYVDSLDFWSKPDYNYIYELLKRALKREGVDDSEPYDWEEKGKHYSETERLPPPGNSSHKEAPASASASDKVDTKAAGAKAEEKHK